MQENIVKITGDGNIVIQDVNSGNITINQNDPQLFEILQKLRNEDIAVLQKMISEQNDKFTKLFKTMVSGLLSQKNIVQGSISNVKSLKIYYF